MPKFVQFDQQKNFAEGSIMLIGRTGIEYPTKALFVPDYGWVPCSRRLCDDFTTDSRKLQLIIATSDDVNTPVTSDIWITRMADTIYTLQ